jgi:hypothetical protein
MSLTGDELWVQLNYQLIHLLDFLPVAHWGENADDMFLQQFVSDLTLKCCLNRFALVFEIVLLCKGLSPYCIEGCFDRDYHRRSTATITTAAAATITLVHYPSLPTTNITTTIITTTIITTTIIHPTLTTHALSPSTHSLAGSPARCFDTQRKAHRTC